MNDFLSHPVWQPFSRLTYTTYLVALPLQYLIIDNLKHPYYFTQLNTVSWPLSTFVVLSRQSQESRLRVHPPHQGKQTFVHLRASTNNIKKPYYFPQVNTISLPLSIFVSLYSQSQGTLLLPPPQQSKLAIVHLCAS